MTSLSCNPDDFKNLISSHPKLVVAFTQDGCVACEHLKGIVQEISPKLHGVSVAEIQVGGSDARCEALADKAKVSATPTMQYYQNGELRKTWFLTGDERKDKEAFLKLASKPTVEKTSVKTQVRKSRKR